VTSTAFSDKIDSGVTQSWGRFRYTETDLYLIGTNLDKNTLLKQLETTDPYLYKAIKQINFYSIKGSNEFNKLDELNKMNSSLKTKGKNPGKYKGKAISQKTLDKKKSITDFKESIDIKNYQTKVQLLNDYIAYCKEQDITPVSKNTLFKDIPLLSKVELALNSATEFKVDTYNNGAIYNSTEDWYTYYKRWAKKNKLKIAPLPVFKTVKFKNNIKDTK